MSGRYRGVYDILTGVFLGASVVKLYYENSSDEENIDSLTFRQNQKKIEQIYLLHENLSVDKNKRIINSKSEGRSNFHKSLRFGEPQNSLLVLHYKNHVLAYDTTRRVPLWVAQHLTKDKLLVKETLAERTKASFKSDMNIPEIFRTMNKDYLNSEWTRGHMAPAGDNRSDQQSMNDTFFLSNVVPQNHQNNTQFWCQVEAFCRHLTNQFSDVYVISGPLWLPCQQDGKKIVQFEVIGESNIAVPTHLFKVILATDNTGKMPYIGAFQIPNAPITFKRDLTIFQVPLEKLEKDSGLLFFPTNKKYEDLCKNTECKLISKEAMALSRMKIELRNAQNIEQLNNVWSTMRTSDKTIKTLYEKKLIELHKKESITE